MKPEQKVWKRLRPILQGVPGLKYERVESGVSGNGVPDVYCAQKGRGAFWFELKADTTEDSTELRFPATESGWRHTQRRWAADSWARDVPVYLVVGKGSVLYFMDTRDITDLDRINVHDKRVQLCSFVTELCASETRTAVGKSLSANRLAEICRAEGGDPILLLQAYDLAMKLKT